MALNKSTVKSATSSLMASTSAVRLSFSITPPPRACPADIYFLATVASKAKEAGQDIYEGKATGKAAELRGEVKGKANELSGKAKGAAAEAKGEVKNKLS